MIVGQSVNDGPLVAFREFKEGFVIYDGEVDGLSFAHFYVQDVFATGGIGRAELSIAKSPAAEFYQWVDFK